MQLHTTTRKTGDGVRRVEVVEGVGPLQRVEEEEAPASDGSAERERREREAVLEPSAAQLGRQHVALVRALAVDRRHAHGRERRARTARRARAV